MSWQFEEEELVETLTDEGSEEGRSLMVFNDEFNSFDHVIDTLIKVCRHNRIQAEQCTNIIHFNGKCKVKNGTLKELKPMKDGVVEAGIKASIL